MKRTFSLLVTAMLLAGSIAFADEAMLIDFAQLDKDCVSVNDQMTQNKRTVMDFSVAAGASFDGEQRKQMKTSLALDEWIVTLNSSARNVASIATSKVVSAPVKESAKVSFAGKNVMGVRVVFPTIACNANVRITPAFDIPAYEPYSEADDDGVRGEPAAAPESETDSIYKHEDNGTLFEDGYGVVKNVRSEERCRERV